MSLNLSSDFLAQVLECRPEWQNPDKQPTDLDRANTALLHDLNPNDPKVHEALLMHHNKFGIAKKTSLVQSIEERGIQKAKRGTHRAITVRRHDFISFHCLQPGLYLSVVFSSFAPTLQGTPFYIPI